MRQLNSVRLTPVFLLLPALLVVGVFVVYPLFSSLWLSLNRLELLHPDVPVRFVGLRNYSTALTEPALRTPLLRTIAFTGVTVGSELLFGFGLALMLNKIRLQFGFLRGLIILPMMVSSAVVALMWRLMWHSDLGMVNYFLALLGVAPRFWLGPSLAFPSIMITQVWQNFPFAAMLILAGLSSLPEEPFEAARLDGATGWQTLRYVTIPLLRPILLVVVLFRTVFALRTFEIIWLLTAGGPADTTMVYSVSIYRESFRYYNLGAASALSWILLIISAVAGAAFVLLSRRASQEAYT